MIHMTMQEWADGPQPACFDFECWTALFSYSPQERRYLGIVLFSTVTPYFCRGFPSVKELAAFVGKTAEMIWGYVTLASEFERRGTLEMSAPNDDPWGIDFHAPQARRSEVTMNWPKFNEESQTVWPGAATHSTPGLKRDAVEEEEEEPGMTEVTPLVLPVAALLEKESDVATLAPTRTDSTSPLPALRPEALTH